MRFADSRNFVIVVVGSLLVTSGLVALVLSLGSWAYHTRRFQFHERRLAMRGHPLSIAIYCGRGVWRAELGENARKLTTAGDPRAFGCQRARGSGHVHVHVDGNGHDQRTRNAN
jgi:hypothetical protein